ncbi:unnamed protein product [Calypogeia fissa]
MQIQKMRTSHQWSALMCLIVCLLSIASNCMAATKYFDFEISLVSYTRNCYTKSLVAVNGQYPGPTIYVDEGDRVIVTVRNGGNANVTIHWHGIRQFRSCWQDGTGYITQCPIQPGSSEVYDFNVTQQRGTTFWHAHVSWLRATVHGAFVTAPATGSYPFQQPDEEIPVILGEWWNIDVELVEQQTLASGGGFPLADATTINGLPGNYYNCSATEGVSTIYVVTGKTYLLRIVNAALNTEMFFAIANHPLTVVEADSNYVKPFTVTEGIVIAPGQTMNVLVTANQLPGTYYMVGKSHLTLLVTDPQAIPPAALPFVLADVPPIPTNGFFQYSGAPVLAPNSTFYPTLPVMNDTVYSDNFANSLKTLNPEMVPSGNNVRHLFYTVGTGTELCSTCAPQEAGFRLTGEVNNISFVNPTISILQAYYYKIPGVYSPTFPDFPPYPYDYTAALSPPSLEQIANRGTRVAMVDYGTVIELVLQDVNNFAFESHPFHLHGNFFYVLGQGYGDYDPTSSPATFNFYDPPARFTVNVPARGWVAIRFYTDNPGVWFFHCHLEKHLSWGMQMVFIVQDGPNANQTLPGPTGTLNPC